MSFDDLPKYGRTDVWEGRCETVKAERDFLLRWLGRRPELTGLSADALSLYVLTGAAPHSRPYDNGDLGRCERAYAVMPPHLQRLAKPVLTRWQQEVRERNGEHLREARKEGR